MNTPVIDENSELGKKSRWYIVHTYSGFEQRVQKTIKAMMDSGEDNGLIQEVVVPTEKVIEPSKNGSQPRTSTRKFYPGYVMIRMIMTDLSCHLVQSIPKVTGFVGGKNRPTPMSESDAARILSLMESRQETPRPKFNFERGRRSGYRGPLRGLQWRRGRCQLRKGQAARIRFHLRKTNPGGTGFRAGFQGLASEQRRRALFQS